MRVLEESVLSLCKGNPANVVFWSVHPFAGLVNKQRLALGDLEVIGLTQYLWKSLYGIYLQDI